jgi:hypothetical protein
MADTVTFEPSECISCTGTTPHIKRLPSSSGESASRSHCEERCTVSEE